MCRASKILLGFFGVTLVAAVTAFAVQIPTSPGVSAASEEIKVSFTVLNGDPSVAVTAPANHSRVVASPATLGVNYEDAFYVIVELVSPSGVSTTLYDDAPLTTSGTLTFPTALPEYGLYTINAYIDGTDGHSYTTTSEFTFASIKAKVTDNGNGEATTTLVGDSTVCVEVDPSVTDSFDLELVNSSGNVVFSKHVESADISAGCTYVEIPVATDNIANGNYDIVVTAYDDESEIIDGPYVIPVIIDIIMPPKTGIFALADAITRDYTVLALLIFTSLILFILFLAKRHRATAEQRK